MDSTIIKTVNIAGFSYYNGAFVFEELKIGTILDLEVEKDNRFDECAIAIKYKGQKLGFVPRDENRELAFIMNSGHNIFKAVVQYLNEERNPEHQVKVGIFVEKSKA